MLFQIFLNLMAKSYAEQPPKKKKKKIAIHSMEVEHDGKGHTYAVYI